MANSVFWDNGEILAHRPFARNEFSPPNYNLAIEKGDMNTKRRIEITVEKQRVLTISSRRVLARGWCIACGTKVHMVTAEDAARVACVTPRTIYQWAEAGQLHFTESQDGQLLICFRSLG